MEEWAKEYIQSNDLDSLEDDIVTALDHAANKAIPTISTNIYFHKQFWYYNDRVRELRYHLISLRKKLRKHPSPTIPICSKTYLTGNTKNPQQLLARIVRVSE